MSNRMSFADVVIEAFDNREMVAQWERLYGMQLVNGWRRILSLDVG